MDSKEIQNDNYYSKIGVQQPTLVTEPTKQPLLHENLNMTDIESVMSDHRRMEDEKSFKKIIRRQENGGDSSSSSDEEELNKLQKSGSNKNEVKGQITFFEQFVMMQVKGNQYV